MSTSSSTPAVQSAVPSAHGHHRVSPSDVAVGVIIGRASEFFDFFVFAIASVIVFPQRIFPFTDPLTGTLLSFALLALAFVARPLGSALFMSIDRRHGRVTKLTAALFLMGTATVAMGLIPSYENVGGWAVVILAVLRIAQGLALGGAWDGMPSLLALTAPRSRRGFYAMVPQLGAPIADRRQPAFRLSGGQPDRAGLPGLGLALSVLRRLLGQRGGAVRAAAHRRDRGIRRAFRIARTPATRIGKTLREDGGAILIGIFVPLASFAMFHMVTVYPLSWIYLYTDETLLSFLIIEAVAATGGILAILLSGWLADRIGRRNLLLVGALLIGCFAALAPLLLSAGKTGELVYMIVGFFILGLSFGQSSGAVASLFEARNRYTGSAIVSDLAWMFGAGFAPLTALLLSTWLGLSAAGLYLLSGAICSTVAILLSGKLEFRAAER